MPLYVRFMFYLYSSVCVSCVLHDTVYYVFGLPPALGLCLALCNYIIAWNDGHQFCVIVVCFRLVCS